MADPKQTDKAKSRALWPVKDRAKDMERNTEFRGQGWSNQRTREVNDQGRTDV